MTTNGDDRFAIIMAGGDGTRLRPFVRSLRQKSLPKQYVNFIGRRSMLEHTIDRARKIIPLERIFAVVSRDHLDIPEAREQLAKLPGENIVVQPLNRGTWPGILLPLARIYADCDDPKIVTFPADHFIEDEEVFLAHVAFALLKVEEPPARMVLLGVTPDGPDPELGYIIPRKPGAAATSGFLPVKEFIEKPSPQAAKELLNQGALWNTLVLIEERPSAMIPEKRIQPKMVFIRSFMRRSFSARSGGNPRW